MLENGRTYGDHVAWDSEVPGFRWNRQRGCHYFDGASWDYNVDTENCVFAGEQCDTWVTSE